MTRRKNVVDAFAEERARRSAKKLFGRWTDHDSPGLAREENQAILHAGHDGIHVLAHCAEDFVHAAQLLADLGNLAAHRAKLVRAGNETFHFRSGHVELSRGDAIQLIGNSAQRSKRRTADNSREACRDNERKENDGANLFDGRQNVMQQQARRNGDAHFAERLATLAERESEFVDLWKARENLYLMQKTTLRQLREWRAMRQEFALRRFVGRYQNHAVAIGNRDLVDVDGVFVGSHLRAKAFIDFEG